MTLLIRPCCYFNADISRLWIGRKGARYLQSINHTHCPIEPARMVLGFKMTADQQRRTGRMRTANNIADAVELRLQPSFAHPRRQPMSRLHVLRRICRAMDASLVRADPRQAAELCKNSVAVNDWHIVLVS